MIPVLMLTHNCLDLTKRAVEAAQMQDVATKVHIVDNGSVDGTKEWAAEKGVMLKAFTYNAGVSVGWNTGLALLFEDPHVGAVFIIGNDTAIPPWFVSELLSYPEPFVTGVSVDSFAVAMQRPKLEDRKTEPHPDFSAFMMRRNCWEKIGGFDETMKLYSSDQDYHLRGWYAGLEMVKVPCAFYHERSSTLKFADATEQFELHKQANLDRIRLREKWGVSAGGDDYSALFSKENFGARKMAVK
jgi:GT2 family glycosyltransferase